MQGCRRVSKPLRMSSIGVETKEEQQAIDWKSQLWLFKFEFITRGVLGPCGVETLIKIRSKYNSYLELHRPSPSRSDLMDPLV
jgi:hypothetical protein